MPARAEASSARKKPLLFSGDALLRQGLVLRFLLLAGLVLLFRLGVIPLLRARLACMRLLCGMRGLRAGSFRLARLRALRLHRTLSA
jgi:hypothetical protein